MGALHFPKLQHHWNLTIRLFSVLSRTLVGGWSYTSAEKQSVYSTIVRLHKITNVSRCYIKMISCSNVLIRHILQIKLYFKSYTIANIWMIEVTQSNDQVLLTKSSSSCTDSTKFLDSLAIRSYCPLLLASPLDCIQCLHCADICNSLLLLSSSLLLK